MTIPTVVDIQKEDLKFLRDQPLNIFIDFCKLSSSYLTNGGNTKLYNTASQKLQIDIKQVESSVQGLAYVFVEANKNSLSENDFKEFIIDLGFSEDFFQPLYEEYLGIKSLLKSSLPEEGIHHFQFRNLEWRFEVQVSSRAMLKKIQPKIVMKLELEKMGEIKNFCLQSDISNLVYMSQQINQALQDSKTNHSKRIIRAIS